MNGCSRQCISANRSLFRLNSNNDQTKAVGKSSSKLNFSLSQLSAAGATLGNGKNDR